CAVSGVRRLELLRASHIKPWACCNNEERLDPSNGILLSPVYDAAFDASLIAFAEDGTILLASDFSADEAAVAGIDRKAQIKLSDEKMQSYLFEHRTLMSARCSRSAELGSLIDP
ncbi:MAG: HNH endonuclease, partial [Sphingobacteriales bacterium]